MPQNDRTNKNRPYHPNWCLLGIVTDDQVNLTDIQTLLSNRCGNQDIVDAFLELIDDLRNIPLRTKLVVSIRIAWTSLELLFLSISLLALLIYALSDESLGANDRGMLVEKFDNFLDTFAKGNEDHSAGLTMHHRRVVLSVGRLFHEVIN